MMKMVRVRALLCGWIAAVVVGEAYAVPTDLLEVLERARYAIRQEGVDATPTASSHAQRLRARFEVHGARIDVEKASLSMSLEAWGVSGSLVRVAVPSRSATAERVEYDHGALTEWWKNGSAGFEHGFDVHQRPAGHRSLPLVLQMRLSSGWTAKRAGTGLLFEGAHGERLAYDKLITYDANGRAIDGHLEYSPSGFAVIVDDAKAVYPLTVDPILTNLQARLEGISVGAEADAQFGIAVAVNGDTAVVGAPFDDADAGANAGIAYVFIREGATWTQQARLLAPAGIAEAFFGHSVAVSEDAVVVGAYFDATAGGARGGSAYVFTRDGATWTSQARLLAADGATHDSFGLSVSVSGDTILVGSPLDDTAAGNDAGSAYVFVRSGATWTQQAQLQAADGGTGDRFGHSVSLSGDTAAVGAYQYDRPGAGDAGAAYVFVRNGASWTQQAELLAPFAAELDRFGVSVAVSADTVVVGASLDDVSGGSDAGSPHVFARTGISWIHQAELLAADGAVNDHFGSSVAVSGDTVVVGAYADDTAAGLGAGSAYVFVRDGSSWTQQAQLFASSAAPQDQFAVSVAIDGDTVIAGANFDDTSGGPDSGSASNYVRSGATWPLQAQLLPTDGATFDRFGWSVSIDGDTAVVGTFGDDTSGGYEAGRAYVFVRSGTIWAQQALLEAPDARERDYFGYAVAVSGDTAVVSSRRDGTVGGLVAGRAYVFVRNGTSWTVQAKLMAAGGAATDHFGSAVAISGDTVAVSAAFDDTPGGLDAGSAYLFTRSGTAWTQEAQLHSPNPSQFGYFSSSLDVHGDTVVVGATHDDTRAANAGAAYVFVRGAAGWTLQAQLLAADGQAGDRLGVSASVNGDTVLVGAPWQPTPASDAGSAYVFVRSGASWTQEARLQASDAAAGDQFGFSVSIRGNIAVIGAPSNAAAGSTDPGGMYVFRRQAAAWSEEAKVSAPDGAPHDRFGYSVSLSGNTAVAGAPYDDTPAGVETGSVHVFILRPRGITVTPVSGLRTTESGGTAAFTIALDSRPAADVTVTLSSTDPTEAAVSPTSVTFSPDTFDVPRPVNLRGVDDAALDGDVPYAIVIAPAISADPDYDGYDTTDVGAVNGDDDAGVSVTSSANPSDIGSAVTFTATVEALGGTPTGAVTFTDGTSTLATIALSAAGVATHTTSALAGGNHTITAVYGGNAIYAPSAGALSHVVATGSTIAFAPADYWTKETASAVAVTVTRTGGDTSGAASVDYATSDGSAAAGARYMPASGTLQFAAGETAKTISVALVDSAHIQGTETFTIVLGSPNAAVLGTATATIHVIDDDVAVTDFSFPLDGLSDLVWRNESARATKVWTMGGMSFLASTDLLPSGASWTFQGAADFNADGSADMLYRNDVDHALLVWYMSGTGVLANGSIPSVPDPNWKIVAIGDMNGDGYPDLLWRHANFTMAVWLMRDAVRVSAYPLPKIADANWQIRGLGDFNRDGQLDIVWRHVPNSLTAVWLMSPGGTALASTAVLPSVGPPWDVVGVGDMNGDGDSDLIWQASTTRTVAVWLMDQTVRSDIVVLPTINDSSWTIVGPR